jgi:hypothetical protein
LLPVYSGQCLLGTNGDACWVLWLTTCKLTRRIVVLMSKYQGEIKPFTHESSMSESARRPSPLKFFTKARVSGDSRPAAFATSADVVCANATDSVFLAYERKFSNAEPFEQLAVQRAGFSFVKHFRLKMNNGATQPPLQATRLHARNDPRLHTGKTAIQTSRLHTGKTAIQTPTSKAVK